MDHRRDIPQRKQKTNTFLILGCLYLLFMVFLIIVPTKTITENVEVSYLDKETYLEKESYEAQEPYDIQEPYQGQEAYREQESYQVTENRDTVKNAPSGLYYTTCGTGCHCSHNVYDPNKIPSSYCDQCTCTYSELVTKYRTVTKYRDVTKYRTITKYQTVTKYKDVSKVRNVTKTRIEPQQVEVNWIFGFKTPYALQLPFIS